VTVESGLGQVAYVRGEFLPLEKATLDIRTHAFLYGTSVFEGIRAYWMADQGQILVFRAKEHYSRLERSCKILYLQCPLSFERMLELTAEILQKNQCQSDTYLRPIVYKADLRIDPFLNTPNTQDDFCLFTVPLQQFIDTRKGLHLGISSWRRLDDNMMPVRAKVSGAYVNSALAKTDAKLSGFDDAILLSEDGHVAEGSAMNLFLVRDGRLITPSVTSNILEGITRDTVIQLAKQELGIAVEGRSLDRTELYVADELFLCGTATEIAPVTKVDHRVIGSGKIGALTQQLQDLYQQVVRGQLPKYQEWLMVVPVAGQF
jgi:branched-chain amino acid aminotransferase